MKFLEQIKLNLSKKFTCLYKSMHEIGLLILRITDIFIANEGLERDFEKRPRKTRLLRNLPRSLLGPGIPSRIAGWKYRRTVKEKLFVGEFADTNACGRKRV